MDPRDKSPGMTNFMGGQGDTANGGRPEKRYRSRERIACDRKSISETATTITTAMAETWA